MAKNSRDAYGFGLGGPSPALSPTPIISTRNPAGSDIGYEIGTNWINTNSNQAWILTSIAAGVATYSLASPGASDVDTINGLSPVAGNMIVDGGTNVTDVNAGNTVTLNLDDAIVLATSVTSPIYTAAAALDINAPAGSNITLQMGDAAGANVIDFEDSASATVATLDSDGTLTVVNMDGIIGATTPAAGTFAAVEAATFGGVGALDTIVTTTLGEDLILRLGDAAGGNFLRVQSSTPGDVFTIDSLGAFSVLAGLTVAGAFAQTAGTFDVGQDNAANAIAIGGGNVARVIGIGNSAAAHTMTVGSLNGAASLDLQCGTGNFSLEGNVASTYDISSTGVNTGTVTIASGTGARTVEIAGGGTGIKTINIGAAATADVIQIGDATGAGSLALLAGTAGFSLQAEGASDITVTAAGTDLDIDCVGGAVNIGSTQAENDAITIDASAANGGIQLSAGTGGIFIGDQADCVGITVGNVAPGATRNITIGGGTVVTAAVTDTISIAGGGATTNANSIKTLNLNTGGVTLGEVLTNIASGAVTSGTHTTSIASGARAAGTMALNLMTGTGTKVANLGNADALTTFNVDAITVINDNVNADFTACTGTSTGAITLGNIATSTAMALQSSTTIDIDAAGAMTMNSTTGTINIGNDDVDQNMGFGTDGERVVTVGSTNGAAGLVLQAGTAGITMTGTVQQIDAELIGTTGIYIPAINQNAMVNTAANTGGVATGATGDVNNVMLQTGVNMNAFVIGAGQTILQPVMGTNGLIISGDQVVAEGYELNLPYHQYTVGTSAAFFFELGLYINDMDGSIPYVFGFRKTEANNAVFANYTDYATIGMIAGSSATNIVVATELNSGGQTVTDSGTAWGGDGSTNTLTVYVSAAGVVTYDINGTPYAGPGFTFDGTDVLIPFIRVEHTATPTEVSITSMRIGFQA